MLYILKLFFKTIWVTIIALFFMGIVGSIAIIVFCLTISFAFSLDADAVYYYSRYFFYPAAFLIGFRAEWRGGIGKALFFSGGSGRSVSAGSSSSSTSGSRHFSSGGSRTSYSQRSSSYYKSKSRSTSDDDWDDVDDEEYDDDWSSYSS
ncbi:hypothetical protein [Brevibacillus dissolubilis]|uniref:hypothetical protein n=1 Tax=Brevibacillus dissolubilis TaxID=1844116 RepID=UPI001116CCC8|nr:hypothetical protein [Brevibacillus dissolubilis]